MDSGYGISGIIRIIRLKMRKFKNSFVVLEGDSNFVVLENFVFRVRLGVFCFIFG